MIRVRILTIVALAALAASACGRSEAPASQGVRVVTLSPSATEVVIALGGKDTLVGVDDYSGELAPGVSHVGSFLTPNLDAIVQLRPTFVVVDDVHADAARKLADTGVATVECAVHALPDVKSALAVVGDRLGKKDAADAAIADIDGAIADARAHRPARRPRVLAIIDRTDGGLGGLVAAGPGSWLDELLAIAGAENVLAASGVRYPKISLEEVLRGKPDVILDLSTHDVEPWKGIDVPAVTAGRVRRVVEPALMHPSPNIRGALAALAKALQ